MPQITVDYSDNLADGFDRPAFARAVSFSASSSIPSTEHCAHD